MDKLIIQPNLCDGCMDCEEACAKLHGTSRIIIREIEGDYYPIICQQCEDAPCKIICPTGAIEEKDILSEKCIGCGLCMLICPFGAVLMEDRKAHKCHQCPDLDTPACIKACSRRAISIIDIEMLKIEKQKQHIAKMSGIGKNTKKGSDIMTLLTAKSKANKAFQ
ncbi:MAG: 4Fe-4S dicluster domain-containing protein [Methanobacteriaceae archaeon]|nr:4Fe-4S dicluster domain-containing protein [Methanobacteriaceae archaeon]MDZ4172843.1 4Fe-4S dicluster domain-containing protein [Methanobacteriaceae archaeon]